MSQVTITPEDRQAIADTLNRYVWCMDTKNIEGVVNVFTTDGIIQDITGKLWNDVAGGVRAFATHMLSRPDRPVSQHWLQPMIFEGVDTSTCRITSYWALLALDADTGNKFFRSFGSYRDICVNLNGHWFIKEKRIDPWKSEEPR